MDSALQECLSKLFNRRNVCLFCVIWLAAQVAFLNACQFEPESGERCNNHSVALQEGGTLEVPRGTPGKIRDFCIWISSASKWDSACHFDDRLCRFFPLHFKKNVFVVGNNLVMKNLRKEDSGRYRILDLSGNCLEINVSVLGSEICNNRSEAVQEGDTLKVPLGTLGNIINISFWNSSVSRWVSDLDKNISVVGNNLDMKNMRKEDSGHYRILDLSGNCLEINVSLSDSSPNAVLLGVSLVVTVFLIIVAIC